ncbi:MAG: cytochrome-c peroxidase [Neptuniibacter sp.]
MCLTTFFRSTLLILACSVSFQSLAFNNTAELGKSLYFDTNLSKNRTQSCASCHAPESGFVDQRPNLSQGAFSLGDDNQSLGDRSAPTTSYASFTPKFHKNSEGIYVGGQFWDGRASTLEDQAGGPPLNPIEMGMPNKASVIERIKENPQYVKAFKDIFGSGIFDNTESAYGAMTKSIAEFERTAFFSPFDSKYDRYLKGEYEMTAQEELGMTLFFSQQFSNCNICHQLKRLPESKNETFSNYKYHNIGVPTNIPGRKANGVALDTQDMGLINNPAVNDPKQAGKFKVPTLRNVAVTGPYMHNGVFQDLRTVILFYNKYNSKSQKRQVNPETGANWLPPEVDTNLSMEELKTGPALDDKKIDALVAFLKTLTDQRYEHMLQNKR